MNASLRLLIIEDSEDDTLLIVRELTRAGYQPSYHRVDTEESVRAALAGGTWDVVLSDFSMPRFKGTDALKILRERDQDTPFIFVSGTIGEDLAVEAMRSGAQDYVIKSNLTRLAPAIERELRDAAVRREQRASEVRFRRVVESGMIGILFWDPQRRIIDANDQFLKIVGYAREDLQAGRIQLPAMTPPEYEPADAHALKELAATGTCTPFEKEYIRKDGTRVPVIVGVALLDDPKHSGIAFVLDNTERKRADAALQARERQQSAVAKLGERAIATADLATLFEAAAIAVSVTLDVRFSHVLELQHDGKSLLLRAGVGWREGSVGHVTVGAGTESQAGYTLQLNEPVISEDLRTETRFRGTDLLHGHGIVSSATVQVPTKTRPFGVLGAHTDRHRTFTQDDIHFLRAVAHILGTTIDRDRAEASARQSQRLESVGSLAGAVAHDFNNLLTVILGEAEIAAGSLGAESATRASLEEIRKAGERAAALTRQLLAFSHKQIVEPKVFDVNELVAGVDKMLHRLIGEDVELTTKLGSERALVRMDPGQLEQVLVNLVVNARDAMPDGGEVTIEMDRVMLNEDYARGRADVQPGEYILLAVSDSGEGMTEEVQAHAFEPFFTTKEVGKGTGLGLATCYGIAKQAGGHIAVYSEVGVGTTMKVYLPRVLQGEPAAQVRGGEALRGGRETILLVEDEDAVRRMGSRMLESRGYRVLPVATGEEALGLLAESTREVDLLFTDVVLKGMNGRVLADRARVLRPELKVVYASGYTADVVLRHHLVDQRVVLVNKPYTAETMLRKVREVLDEK